MMVAAGNSYFNWSSLCASQCPAKRLAVLPTCLSVQNQLAPHWRQLVTRNNSGQSDPRGDVWGVPYRWGCSLVAYNSKLLCRSVALDRLVGSCQAYCCALQLDASLFWQWMCQWPVPALPWSVAVDINCAVDYVPQLQQFQDPACLQRQHFACIQAHQPQAAPASLMAA